jgi:WD40 repeat protein
VVAGSAKQSGSSLSTSGAFDVFVGDLDTEKRSSLELLKPHATPTAKKVLSVASAADFPELLATAGHEKVVRLWGWDAASGGVGGEVAHAPEKKRKGSIVGRVMKSVRGVSSKKGERSPRDPPPPAPKRKQPPSGGPAWVQTAELETKQWVNSISLAHDGKLLAAGCRNGDVIVWRSSDPNPLSPAWELVTTQPTSNSMDSVDCVAFDPLSSSWCATAGSDGSEPGIIKVWELDDGMIASSAHEFQCPTAQGITAIAPHYAGNMLAVGGREGALCVFDVRATEGRREGRVLAEIVASSGGARQEIVAATFTVDGDALVAATTDGTVKIWSTSNWELLTTLDQPMAGGKCKGLATNEAGTIAMLRDDGGVRTWDRSNNGRWKMSQRVMDQIKPACIAGVSICDLSRKAIDESED